MRTDYKPVPKVEAPQPLTKNKKHVKMQLINNIKQKRLHEQMLGILDDQLEREKQINASMA